MHPRGVGVDIVPLISDQWDGPEENCAKTQHFRAAPGLGDGIIHTVGRNHAGADEAGGIFSAKIVKPVVVGTGDCCGKTGVHVIDHQSANPASDRAPPILYLRCPWPRVEPRRSSRARHGCDRSPDCARNCAREPSYFPSWFFAPILCSPGRPCAGLLHCSW